MEVHESLLDFLELIGEMIFSNRTKYKYDNFYFFTECVKEIINFIKFDAKLGKEKILKNLGIFERILKIVKITISHISMFQPDPLNCVNCIIDKIRIIKSEQILVDLINGYFFKDGNLDVARDESIK